LNPLELKAVRYLADRRPDAEQRFRAAMGPGHFAQAIASWGIGGVKLAEGKPDEAREAYAQGVENYVRCPSYDYCRVFKKRLDNDPSWPQ